MPYKGHANAIVQLDEQKRTENVDEGGNGTHGDPTWICQSLLTAKSPPHEENAFDH